jgi:ADP-heptose:LPS heptosyltransferase
MQCRSFDLAMQMHGAGEITNVIVSQFGATAMAGFYRRGNYCPDPTRFVDYPDLLPERRRHLRLLSALEVEARGEQLEFPIEDADRRELAELFRKANTRPSASVCIHPGATDPARRWRAEHFAAVGDALAGRGLRVVLTGTEDERELVGSVKAAMAAPAVDLSGKTSLGALAALLASCRLVVSNDTGTAHLADALGTPSVVIFRSGDSEVERWAPVDRELHRVMSSGDDPVAVVDAAGELLQEAPVHAA